MTAGDLTYRLTTIVIKNRNGFSLSVGAKTLHPTTAKLFDLAIAGFLGKEPRFADYATALGCLDCMSREFVRREKARAGGLEASVNHYATRFYAEKVAPYEDRKRQENGDVFP